MAVKLQERTLTQGPEADALCPGNAGRGMATFHYRGFVLPDERPLTLRYGPAVERSAAEEPAATFKLSVVEGDVVVEVQVDHFDDGVGLSLHFAANDLVRASVEVASFATGVAHFATLNECIRPDGSSIPLILGDQQLGEVCEAFSSDNLEAATDLILSDIDLARALSDAVMMLSWPHYAPIAGGRVADSLVRMLTGGRSAKDWERMRDVLRVDRKYVEFLSQHSAPPRHGDRVAVPAEVNMEIARRTWTLLDRCFSYRLEGESALAPDRFPVLMG